MELNKAIEVLKDRVDNNNIILDTPYDNDFDEFVRIENEAIEVVLEYIKGLEDKIRCEEKIKYIVNIYEIDYYSCKGLCEKLFNKTNSTREEAIDIILDRIENMKTFYDIIEEFCLHKS